MGCYGSKVPAAAPVVTVTSSQATPPAAVTVAPAAVLLEATAPIISPVSSVDAIVPVVDNAIVATNPSSEDTLTLSLGPLTLVSNPADTLASSVRGVIGGSLGLFTGIANAATSLDPNAIYDGVVAGSVAGASEASVHAKSALNGISAAALALNPSHPSNFKFKTPKIANSIVDLIGRTPIVRLGKLAREAGVVSNILLKLESMEPASSVKDRLAKALIEGAEARGEIKAGETVLVEPTSGNTGIGLTMVGAAKGYEVILVMPATMSLERRVMLKALGAKLILTPGDKGMKGAIAKAEEVVGRLEGKGRILGQFDNSDNPKIHRETTGPEIWYQTDGAVDILVGGVGTGGTITGCAQFLKSVKPELKVVAVEPTESPVISGGAPGPHKIQGIGAGFIPANLQTDLLDETVTVSSETAIATARKLAVGEGIFVGISSGAAVAVAIQVGLRPENAGKNIVVIIPSFGERYLSTALFADVAAEAATQQPEPLVGV